ncbi:hypothetical protein HMPREF0208_04850 [Citrobacter koseri]|nr:hypothetical protein HMPREF0208_04850 [Citrobacter koseri]
MIFLRHSDIAGEADALVDPRVHLAFQPGDVAAVESDGRRKLLQLYLPINPRFTEADFVFHLA